MPNFEEAKSKQASKSAPVRIQSARSRPNSYGHVRIAGHDTCRAVVDSASAIRTRQRDSTTAEQQFELHWLSQRTQWRCRAVELASSIRTSVALSCCRAWGQRVVKLKLLSRCRTAVLSCCHIVEFELLLGCRAGELHSICCRAVELMSCIRTTVALLCCRAWGARALKFKLLSCCRA